MITMEFQNLTYRQKEVCVAFAKSKGVNVIEFIAKTLSIKQSTVRTHLSDIYTALLLESQVQLMYYLLIKR